MNTETKKWSASIQREILNFVVATFRVGDAFYLIMRETIAANWLTKIAENFHWPTVLRVTTKKKIHSSRIQAAKIRFQGDDLNDCYKGAQEYSTNSANAQILETEASSEFFFIRKML